MKCSASMLIVSSTEEESDEEVGTRDEKEMVGGRINNNPSDASHSSGEEYFGIDEEGNAYALKCSTSNKLLASGAQEGCLGDESTTEDESEDDPIIKVASPQSAERPSMRRAVCGRPLHTSSLEKRTGRGRGKQVTSFLSQCWQSHQNGRRSYLLLLLLLLTLVKISGCKAYLTRC